MIAAAARRGRLAAILAGLLLCAALSAAAQAAGDPDGGQPQGQEWQMQRGETLNSLAALFYPGDGRMQQRFVAATLAMNRAALPELAADQPFEQEAAIRIPDLRALSYGAVRPGKRAAAQRPPAASAPAAGGRRDAGGAASDAARPDAEYEAAVGRNRARQQELEQLNQRLHALEARSQEMRQSLAQTPPSAAEADPPRPLKRVQAPDMPAPSGSGLGIALGVLAAVAAGLGIAGYRWHRARRSGGA